MKFFALFLLLSATTLWAEVSPERLSLETQKRLQNVPEFAFIQEEARKLGIDVYLFGGTASAFAHYVRWDLEREDGDDKYQKERFDYDFTNIYRGNQDLDIVVDGSPAKAKKLKKVLIERFPHFIGERNAWEVRLLKEPLGDKLPLLEDFDFKNQHTDTNSTGLLNLTTKNSDQIFRDLLDWENTRSQFLMDTSQGTIKFLFQKKHKETSRFKKGLNPPILSAIRYIAKLTQYEVLGTPEDLETVTRIIQSENFQELSDYSKKKIEEFSLKALLNSPDIEYAWNLLEKTGLRKKLIELDKENLNSPRSLSWWMNKEPLRSFTLGTAGKTAQELFDTTDIIVAHETDSFTAYESITRSAHGVANVFISRQDSSGEAAHYGNGFYTRLGKEGARGTQLVIRFKLHPQARLGIDFEQAHDFIIVKNRNALRLIQENLNIDLIDFFKLLELGEVNPEKNKGLFQKLKRKFDRQIINKKNLINLRDFLKNHFYVSQELSQEIHLNFDLILSSTDFDSIVDYFYEIKNDFLQQIRDLIELNSVFWQTNIPTLKKLLEIPALAEDFLRYVLSHPRWTKHPELIDHYINLYKDSDLRALSQVLLYILSTPHWINHPQAVQWLKLIFIKLKSTDSNRNYLHQGYYHEDFALRNDAEELFQFLIDNTSYKWMIARYIASDKKWADHSYVRKYILDLIKQNNSLDIIRYVLPLEHYASYPESQEFIDQIIKNDKEVDHLLENVLSKEVWQKHSKFEEWIDLIIQDQKMHHYLVRFVFSHNHMINHPKFDKWLSILQENKNMRSSQPHSEIANSLLSLSTSPQHKGLGIYADSFIENISNSDEKTTLNFLRSPSRLVWFSRFLENGKLKILIDSKKYDSLLVYIASEEDWKNFPHFTDMISTILTHINEQADKQMALIFISNQWQDHPDLDSWMDIIVSRFSHNREVGMTLMSLIFGSDYWSNHPKADFWLNKLEYSNWPNHIKLNLYEASKWSNDPGAANIIMKTIKNSKKGPEARNTLLRKILFKPHWINHPRFLEFFKISIEVVTESSLVGGNIDDSFADVIYHHPKRTKIFNIIQDYKNINTDALIFNRFLNHKKWVEDQDTLKLLMNFVSNNLITDKVFEFINSSDLWKNNSLLKKYLNNQEINSVHIRRQLKLAPFDQWLESRPPAQNSFSCSGIL